jgi:hypothetical protein
MIRRYVVRAAAEGLFDGVMPVDRVRAWAGNFPSNAVRRMSKLGLMLGETLREFPIAPEDAVVYATTFAEPIATERYLESFPAASPLYFQTSIHPSAIEQVLITRGCPVRELTPLAGQAHLSAQAALMALLTPMPRVLLTGGEEIGTWFRDLDAASHVGFAFALELGAAVDAADPTEPPEAALGELSWSGPENHPSHGCACGACGDFAERSGAPAGDLRELFQAVSARHAMRCPSPAGGHIELTWF